jgi:hypothetical protein
MTSNFSIDDVFVSKYLTAADLVDEDGNPKDFTLTIDDAWIETLKDRKTGAEEQKIGVSFKGAKKGMLLNKTNSKRIAQLLGSPRPKDWVGKRITLYQTEVDFQGEMKPAIRIRGKLPGHEQSASVGHAAPRPAVTQDDPRTTPQIDNDEQRARFELGDEIPF